MAEVQIQQLLRAPLDIIDQNFQTAAQQPDFKPTDPWGIDSIREALKQQPALIDQIPLLNTTPPQDIAPGTLVRYRGMVQDMWNPEYFVGAFQEASADGQSHRWRSGKYRDEVRGMDGGELNVDPETVTMMERQQYYCVPVPGETQWIQQRNYPTPATNRTNQQPAMRKRTMEPEEDPVSEPVGSFSEEAEDMEMDCANDAGASNQKRNKGAAEAPAATSGCHKAELHFPIPDQPGCACVVKVYAEQSPLKICDVAEFFGVLSFEPERAAFADPENDLMIEEESLGAPPASLVPRLHCLLFEQLEPAAPLLAGVPAQLAADATTMRANLLGALTTALGGDALAAEYTLLHLLSSVHARPSGFVLGKLSLNLVAKGFHWTPLIALIEQLVPRFVPLDLSIANLCRAPFAPSKDYNTNRLRSGILQLSSGTHLALDESVLEPGQLDGTGLMNIKSLGVLMMQQQVEYDFQFYKTEFIVDIPTLVTSAGKSMLPADCLVPVQSKWLTQPVIAPALETQSADALRGYVAYCKQVPYNVPEALTQAIEQDFVNARQNGDRSITPEVLSGWLQLARLVTLSFGSNELTPEIWAHTKELEKKRQVRVDVLPTNATAVGAQ